MDRSLTRISHMRRAMFRAHEWLVLLTFTRSSRRDGDLSRARAAESDGTCTIKSRQRAETRYRARPTRHIDTRRICMSAITKEARELIATGPYAHLTTLNDDGSPQVDLLQRL